MYITLASFLRYIRSLLALSFFLSFHFPVGLFAVFVFRAADPSVGEERSRAPLFLLVIFVHVLDTDSVRTPAAFALIELF